MTDGDDSAFTDSTITGHVAHATTPLTKREYFAAMAMQGYISSQGYMDGGNYADAVDAADELIEALNK